MFSRATKTSSQGGRTTAAPSIISSDSRFTGDIVSQGEMHLDGHVQGDIHCHTLVIGESGNVVGEIVAEMVKVHGVVTGQIRAHSVMLARTARVIGDIAHVSLAIEAGAHMEGRCVRIEETSTAAAFAVEEPELAGHLPAPAE